MISQINCYSPTTGHAASSSSSSSSSSGSSPPSGVAPYGLDSQVAYGLIMWLLKSHMHGVIDWNHRDNPRALAAIEAATTATVVPTATSNDSTSVSSPSSSASSTLYGISIHVYLLHAFRIYIQTNFV